MIPSDDELRIRKLEEELYIARQNLVRLMPEEIAEQLESGLSCETWDEHRLWEYKIAERLVSFAKVNPALPGTGTRAICPLCGQGSVGSWEKGFVIPKGLVRHFHGEGARMCPVTEAAFKNGRTRFR